MSFRPRAIQHKERKYKQKNYDSTCQEWAVEFIPGDIVIPTKLPSNYGYTTQDCRICNRANLPMMIKNVKLITTVWQGSGEKSCYPFVMLELDQVCFLPRHQRKHERCTLRYSPQRGIL